MLAYALLTAFSFLWICPSFCHDADTQKQSTLTPETTRSFDQQDREVIARWADMVGSFFKIVQDPENKENVGQQITKIVSHIAQVIMQESQRSGIHTRVNSEEMHERISKNITPLIQKAVTRALNEQTK